MPRMSREGIKLAGSEAAAWDKLMQGLRHSIEALTEIGYHRGEPQWMQGGIIFQIMLDKFLKLRVAKTSQGKLLGLDQILKAGRE
jgi:hypothetical protein